MRHSSFTPIVALLFLVVATPGISSIHRAMSSQKDAGYSSSRAHSGSSTLDVDGYPVAPPDLELAQVHVYIRHGTSLGFCPQTMS